ncbi:MAG TPA: tetratricopeptide repeat protein [Acidobacteriota bacterium]|nr:tetratricopeptide repeat protein [Acidobacteriota bacterium]
MTFVVRVGPAFSSTPSDPRAASMYAEALNSLKLFDALAARNLLHKAMGIDPNDPLLHSALAETLSILGYDEKAREEAKHAFDLCGHLAREEQILIEGLFHELSNDWEKAMTLYHSLRVFFPTNLEIGLRLAMAQTHAGHGKKAQVTLTAMQKLPPPVNEDPRIDMTEALAADSLSDFVQKLKAANRVTAKAAAMQTRAGRLLLARARLIEAEAHMDLGRPRNAKSALNEARRIFTQEGDQSGLAGALLEDGNIARRGGDLPGAKKLYDQALSIFQKIGDRRGEAATLNILANHHRIQGYLSVARQTYEESLKIARELGETLGITRALMGTANVMLQEGELENAKKLFTESLEISRKAGYRIGIARSLNSMAAIHHYQGRLTEARMFYEEVLVLKQEMGDRSSTAYTLLDLARVHLAEGNLEESRSRCEESLEIRTEIGEKGTAAESRVLLAVLRLEEEKAEEAEYLAMEASEEFKRQTLSEEEAYALAVLGMCRVKKDKKQEALAAVEKALSLSTRSRGLRNHLVVSILAARVQAQAGGPVDSAEALTRIQGALDEATRAGFVDLGLIARFVSAEIEMRTAGLPGTKNRLLALQKEALERRFGLIAQKAAALLEPVHGGAT